MFLIKKFIWKGTNITFLKLFLMIFKNLMSPRKSRCDIPNGTTQGWVGPYILDNLVEFYLFDLYFFVWHVCITFETFNKRYFIRIFSKFSTLQVYFFYMYVCMLDLLFSIGYGPMLNCFQILN
jgi:hypothetical protein